MNVKRSKKAQMVTKVRLFEKLLKGRDSSKTIHLSPDPKKGGLRRLCNRDYFEDSSSSLASAINTSEIKVIPAAEDA